MHESLVQKFRNFVLFITQLQLKFFGQLTIYSFLGYEN